MPARCGFGPGNGFSHPGNGVEIAILSGSLPSVIEAMLTLIRQPVTNCAQWFLGTEELRHVTDAALGDLKSEIYEIGI